VQHLAAALQASVAECEAITASASVDRVTFVSQLEQVCSQLQEEQQSTRRDWMGAAAEAAAAAVPVAGITPGLTPPSPGMAAQLGEGGAQPERGEMKVESRQGGRGGDGEDGWEGRGDWDSWDGSDAEAQGQETGGGVEGGEPDLGSAGPSTGDASSAGKVQNVQAQSGAAAAAAAAAAAGLYSESIGDQLGSMGVAGQEVVGAAGHLAEEVELLGGKVKRLEVRGSGSLRCAVQTTLGV